MSMDGLSKRSIMYWARQDAAEKYHEIRNDTIDYYIDQIARCNRAGFGNSIVSAFQGDSFV